MGLASKLNAGAPPAASQSSQAPPQPGYGQTNGYSRPEQQQQQWPQQPAQADWQAFPSQQTAAQPGLYPKVSYAAPAYPPQSFEAGAPQQGLQQQGYHQQPPVQQQSPYGAPYGHAPAAQPADPGLRQGITAKLQQTVATNKLQAFYPPARIQQVADRVAQVDMRQLAQRWKMPVELALDLVALALYDVIIYADDSTSMKYNEDRIDDLKVIVSKVAEVATLFDDDGITVRYMNSKAQGDNLRTAHAASQFVLNNSNFEGMTPMATSLDAKIIQPFVAEGVKRRNLQKPVLVITVTDGEPTSEPETKIFQVIKAAKKMVSKSAYGAGAVAFEFAQVGRDQDAQAFLARLDNDPEVGGMVDATSYYELEAEECAKKGVTLSPELWLVKLMVGAVDPSYDDQD